MNLWSSLIILLKMPKVIESAVSVFSDQLYRLCISVQLADYYDIPLCYSYILQFPSPPPPLVQSEGLAAFKICKARQLSCEIFPRPVRANTGF